MPSMGLEDMVAFIVAPGEFGRGVEGSLGSDSSVSPDVLSPDIRSLRDATARAAKYH